MDMQIELAKSYGFCFGVKRAIRIAENAGADATIGELIHNRRETERLRENFGVKTLADVSELTTEKTAIIRTHGITKSDLATLKERGVNVIDATCPFVKNPRQIVEKMSADGYDIVIFGDSSHPEVKGIVSFATTPAFVVASVQELESVRLGKKVALLSQTTKKLENFVKITSFLATKIAELRVFNTICNATLNNQDAVSELAQRSDVLVIIGGRNSSNTKQLHLIASGICKDSYLIENEDELNAAWFKDKLRCGVSAGASTPQWAIERVIERIKQLTQE